MTTKDTEEFGSGSYSVPVYLVEARASHREVVLRVGDMPLDTLILTQHEWKSIPVNFGPVGVPNDMGLYAEAAAHRFMTYECAMAISCWLQAGQRYGGIQTRVVQVQFTSSYSTKLSGRSEPLDLFEDRRQLLWKLQADEKRRVEATKAGAVARPDGISNA